MHSRTSNQVVEDKQPLTVGSTDSGKKEHRNLIIFLECLSKLKAFENFRITLLDI